MTIPIMLAINDDIGNHTGKVRNIEVGDQFGDGDYIHLEYTGGKAGMVCVISGKTLKLGRRNFMILSYNSFVGNICWECAFVSEQVAADVLNYLRSHGYWSADEATEKFYKKWESKGKFIADDFKPEPEDEFKTNPLQLPLP